MFSLVSDEFSIWFWIKLALRPLPSSTMSGHSPFFNKISKTSVISDIGMLLEVEGLICLLICCCVKFNTGSSFCPNMSSVLEIFWTNDGSSCILELVDGSKSTCDWTEAGDKETFGSSELPDETSTTKTVEIGLCIWYCGSITKFWWFGGAGTSTVLICFICSNSCWLCINFLWSSSIFLCCSATMSSSFVDDATLDGFEIQEESMLSMSDSADDTECKDVL